MFSSILEFIDKWYNASGKDHVGVNIGVAFLTAIVVGIGSIFFSMIA